MDKWDLRQRPVRLERRFEFETYEETRDFLDRLGNLSEEKKPSSIQNDREFKQVTWPNQ